MKSTWILVANAFQAQLYEREGPKGELQPLESFVHPEARLKSGDLEDDQLGRTMSQSGGRASPASYTGGRTAYAPHTETKEKEQERFARQIVDHLQQGVHGNRYGSLIVFASHQMLGAIRDLLDAPTSKLVRHSAAIDLTSFSGRELEARIAQQLES